MPGFYFIEMSRNYLLFMVGNKENFHPNINLFHIVFFSFKLLNLPFKFQCLVYDKSRIVLLMQR